MLAYVQVLATSWPVAVMFVAGTAGACVLYNSRRIQRRDDIRLADSQKTVVATYHRPSQPGDHRPEEG